eukprot:INCI7635.2.p1 GENE.INCI7635.2~~INCI7635.2.p1  ORF type:complete len:717 (-),score=120.76 INCI7635.2:515-2665(-)
MEEQPHHVESRRWNVRCLFNHFDLDRDGLLSLKECNALCSQPALLSRELTLREFDRLRVAAGDAVGTPLKQQQKKKRQQAGVSFDGFWHAYERGFFFGLPVPDGAPAGTNISATAAAMSVAVPSCSAQHHEANREGSKVHQLPVRNDSGEAGLLDPHREKCPPKSTSPMGNGGPECLDCEDEASAGGSLSTGYVSDEVSSRSSGRDEDDDADDLGQRACSALDIEEFLASCQPQRSATFFRTGPTAWESHGVEVANGSDFVLPMPVPRAGYRLSFQTQVKQAGEDNRVGVPAVDFAVFFRSAHPPGQIKTGDERNGTVEVDDPAERFAASRRLSAARRTADIIDDLSKDPMRLSLGMQPATSEHATVRAEKANSKLLSATSSSTASARLHPIAVQGFDGTKDVALARMQLGNDASARASGNLRLTSAGTVFLRWAVPSSQGAGTRSSVAAWLMPAAAATEATVSYRIMLEYDEEIHHEVTMAPLARASLRKARKAFDEMDAALVAARTVSGATSEVLHGRLTSEQQRSQTLIKELRNEVARRRTSHSVLVQLQTVLQHLLRFSDGEVDDVDPSVGPLLEHVDCLMSRFSHPSYRHPSRKELHTRLPETATTVPESGNFLRFQLQRDAEHGFGLVVRTVQYQCQEAHPLRFADSFQEEENGLVGPKSDPKLADKTATTSGCSIDAAASSSFLVVVEMPPVRSSVPSLILCGVNVVKL